MFGGGEQKRHRFKFNDAFLSCLLSYLLINNRSLKATRKKGNNQHATYLTQPDPKSNNAARETDNHMRERERLPKIEL